MSHCLRFDLFFFLPSVLLSICPAPAAQATSQAAHVATQCPVRIDVAPIEQRRTIGSLVPVLVTLLGCDGRAAPASEAVKAEVQAIQPSGQTDRHTVTFSPGESCKRVNLPISEKGITQLSVRDLNAADNVKEKLWGGNNYVRIVAEPFLPMTQVNFYSTVAITLLNLPLLWWVLFHPERTPHREQVLWSHGLWSGMWLMWTLAWIVLDHLSQVLPLAILLEDIGSCLLIGSALIYLEGVRVIKHWMIASFALLSAMDFLWYAVVTWKGWNVGFLTQPGSNALNTVAFAPSLCLVVFAMGLIAWSAWHLPVIRDLRFTMAFVAVGYAVIQVVIYQVNFFTPNLRMPPLWQDLLFVWRIAFVSSYWLVVVVSLGVKLPVRPVLQKLAWLTPVVTSLVVDYLEKSL